MSALCQKRTYLCAPFVGEQRQLKNPVEKRKGNTDFGGTRDLAIFSVLEPQGESGVSVSCRRPQHGGHSHDHCLRTALVGFSNLRSAGRCMRQRIHQTQSEQLRLDCSGYGRSGSRLDSTRDTPVVRSAPALSQTEFADILIVEVNPAKNISDEPKL